MSNLFKKVTSTTSALAIVATAMSSSLTAFAASEFATFADSLAEAGVINTQSSEAGYRLGDNITRAEMAKIAVVLADDTAVECAGDVFSDVTSAQGDLCGFIESAAALEIVSTANTKFRPSDLVTRAEMVKMLLSARGVAPTDVSAEFDDVPASMGDLYGYVNAAVAEGLIKAGTSFRPNATATRGEAFKVASNALALDTTMVEPPVDTSTGTTTPTSTGSTSTGVVTPVASGDLDVNLNPASLLAGTSVPKVGTIVAAKLDFTAGGSDISVNNITLKRDGLGLNSEITNVWFEIAGQKISTKASVSSDSLVVVSFSPSLVITAGSTITTDLIVQLNSASASQHRFIITSADSIVSSAAKVTGVYPLATNTVITANYSAATVTVSRNTTPPTTVKVGDMSTVLGDFMLTLGNENRDVSVNSFTLYNSGTTDLYKSVSNLALYNKSTGMKVSTDVKFSGRYVTFTLNDTIPYTLSNRSYQVKGDIISADRSSDTISLTFDSKTEYIVVNEKDTGFRAAIIITGTTGDLGTSAINLGDFSIVKDSTVSSVTVARNTTGVKLLAGIIKVQQPTTIQNITVTFTGGTNVFASGATRVKLVIGDISSTQDASGSVTFTNTYTISKDTPVYVYGDIKSTAALGTYSAQSLTYDTARYVSNDQGVVNPTNAFESAGSNTINVTVSAPTVTVSNNGAAASAQTVIGAKDVTLGKFSFANNDLSPVTVSNLTFSATGTVVSNFFTNTTVDLYVDGVIKESRKLTATPNVAFSSTSYTIDKGKTSNVELVVSSVQNSYGTGTFRVTFSTGSFSDDVGQTVSVNGTPSGTYFTFNSKGSVTLSALPSDNQAKILVAGANQEIGKFTMSAQNDSVNLLDFYASFSGVTDASANLSNVTLVAGGVEIAKGSVVGNTLKFTSINSGNGYQIMRGADPVTVTVKADILTLSTADSGTDLTLVLGTTTTSIIDDSTNVADNAVKIRSTATSQYLGFTDVTTPTTAVATHRLANSKIVVSAFAGTVNDEHKFSISADAAGRVAISALNASISTGTGLTGILYLGSVGTANQVATWGGNSVAAVAEVSTITVNSGATATGTVVLNVNGNAVTTASIGSGSTSAQIATAIGNAIGNTAGSGSATATVSGSIVTVTAGTVGARTDTSVTTDNVGSSFTVTTSNQGVTASGGFTITGASTTNSTIILNAGTTGNFILKLTGVSSSSNANSVRTLTINGVSYKDYVDSATATTAVDASSYTNVGLPVSSSTTY